ncbi:MAG: hypothetical protein ABIS28_14490 [Caldimonas sp.]
MTEPKDNTTSFFRKVVKFVANPATEWAELDAPPEDLRGNDYAKGELKAMIERKRRNDFVRKRELDMLRNVRREGLTGDQLAALGGSSGLDDSEPRLAEGGARQDIGVKAKIDEIEQQMVGDHHYAPTTRRGPENYDVPTEPARLDSRSQRPRPAAPAPAPVAAAPTPDWQGGRVEDFVPPVTARQPLQPAAAPAPAARPAMAPISLAELQPEPERLVDPGSVASSEVVHDPELDEAVIAFANADFEPCEQALVDLTGPGGLREQHPETWLVLFDLYRAIGQQHKFESLALDYAQRFGWSAPQWFSIPRLVAEAVGEERTSSSRIEGQVGWVCPDYLDAEGVATLASRALQMPLPWVFDWSALKGIDVEACAKLSDLFRSWIPQPVDMRWISGEKLFTVLHDAAPNGVRDADPAYWQLRLDALRMANRPDQFDEAAIDYCVTYEVSPPSWEPSQCEVRISGSGNHTTQQPLSVVSEVSKGFGFEDSTQAAEEASRVQVDSVELSGQLIGDITSTLKKIDAELGSASRINVACSRLIRVDFIAAGDLLNWVLSRRNENRSVHFVDAHRMIALFFGAMGINEHASVKIRTL